MTEPHRAGVVVGRFQVPELHPGHHHLLQAAAAHNDSLLVVLGSPRSLATARNPLSFAVRKSMITKAYPAAVVVEQFDHPSDEVWSHNLDALIAASLPRNHEAVLYGSRDPFFPHYFGTYKTQTVPELPGHTGTVCRMETARTLRTSPDFRAGIIHAETTRLPRVFPTVDVAVLRPSTQQVLLASKKADGGRLRFIGGFVDPTDTSLEQAARRETYEETGGLGTEDYCYLGSALIDDWRYRTTEDRIVTTFFSALYTHGFPTPSDDIDTLAWIPYDQIRNVLSPGHLPLGEMLLARLAKNS